MLNFTKFERISPEKRDVLQRLKDFGEIYEVFMQKSIMVTHYIIVQSMQKLIGAVNEPTI